MFGGHWPPKEQRRDCLGAIDGHAHAVSTIAASHGPVSQVGSAKQRHLLQSGLHPFHHHRALRTFSVRGAFFLAKQGSVLSQVEETSLVP